VTANDKVIGTVAREAKVKISDQELYVDGLGAEGSQAETYVGMLTSNTCAIVDGLGGKCTPSDLNWITFCDYSSRQAHLGCSATA